MSPRVLVLAGHDPTHGAGVDADREACAHFDVEAECVVTAWTEQDGQRVRSLGARPPAEWQREARAALARAPAAIKIGLLPGREHVLALAGLLKEEPGARAVPLVLDPLFAASGGETFLDDDGIEAFASELLPLASVLTPNLPEAARLSDLSLAELAAHPARRPEACARLLEAGARAVILTGGHGHEDPVQDLLLERGRDPLWLTQARAHGASLHGSGCRHASAVAAGLARGKGLPRAAREAGAWVAELVRASREG